MSFKINFCNIRGLNANLNQVHHHLISDRPQLLFLTETQISQPLSDVHLSCPGYSLYSNFARKAGVCVFARDDLPVSHLINFDVCCKHFQLLWMKVCLRTGPKVICCLYRSPNSPESSDQLLFDQLNLRIEETISNFPDSEISILGDFNIHNKDWLLHSSHTDNAGLFAESFAISNNLTQLVACPTRVPDQSHHFTNMLDLFLTSNPTLYDTPKCLAPIGKSDHNLLSFMHTLTIKKPSSKRSKVWQFSKADWNSLRDYYGSFPWNEVCFVPDTSSTADHITQVILDGMNFFIPSRSNLGSPFSPKWFNFKCAASIELKQKAFHVFKSDPSIANHQAYRKARNVCNDTINQAKKEFISHTAHKLSNCPSGSKSFWSLANRISKNFCGSSFPPMIKNDGSIVSDPLEKANLFASMFASNSTIDDTGKTPPSFPLADQIMRPFIFTTREVRHSFTAS